MFAFGPNKKTPVVRVIGWGLYYHLRIRIHLGIPFQTKTNERADVFFSWLAWGALTSVLSSEGRFLRAALAAKLMAEAWEETIHLGEDLQGSAPGAATKGAATTGAAPHGGKWVVTHNEAHLSHRVRCWQNARIGKIGVPPDAKNGLLCDTRSEVIAAWNPCVV